MHKLATLVVLLAATQTRPTFAAPPATAPTADSTTDSTTAPATEPAASISLDAYFAPVDAQEVKLKPKGYSGIWKVAQAVAHGAKVKAGDVLVSFEASEIDDAILTATSDLDVAQASLAHEETDLALAEQQDAMTLEQRTDAVSDAQLGVDYWKKVDGPDFLKKLDLSVKDAKDSVGDQNDELDQLRKMYKSEQLTNATADIVVKRAVRSYERSQEMQALTEHAAEKGKATAYVDAQQAVDRALADAKHQLADFNATTAQSKVTRAASMLKARLAVKEAQKKLSELEQDKALLSVKASADGVAYYGGFENGTWQGATPTAIAVGEKLDAGKTVLTVVRPGKLRATAKVEEANLLKIKLGDSVRLEPAAMPGETIAAKAKTLSPLPSADGNYELQIELAGDADPRLIPGMKAKAEIEPAGGK